MMDLSSVFAELMSVIHFLFATSLYVLYVKETFITLLSFLARSPWQPQTLTNCSTKGIPSYLRLLPTKTKQTIDAGFLV